MLYFYAYFTQKFHTENYWLLSSEKHIIALAHYRPLHRYQDFNSGL